VPAVARQVEGRLAVGIHGAYLKRKGEKGIEGRGGRERCASVDWWMCFPSESTASTFQSRNGGGSEEGCGESEEGWGESG
jgi:hypothetical protein